MGSVKYKVKKINLEKLKVFLRKNKKTNTKKKNGYSI
tara:strand:+ start:1020 stop:1130 length:111 start_codon:yes stop_codon:yes gene_type:complete